MSDDWLCPMCQFPGYTEVACVRTCQRCGEADHNYSNVLQQPDAVFDESLGGLQRQSFAGREIRTQSQQKAEKGTKRMECGEYWMITEAFTLVLRHLMLGFDEIIEADDKPKPSSAAILLWRDYLLAMGLLDITSSASSLYFSKRPTAREDLPLSVPLITRTCRERKRKSNANQLSERLIYDAISTEIEPHLSEQFRAKVDVGTHPNAFDMVAKDRFFDMVGSVYSTKTNVESDPETTNNEEEEEGIVASEEVEGEKTNYKEESRTSHVGKRRRGDTLNLGKVIAVAYLTMLTQGFKMCLFEFLQLVDRIGSQNCASYFPPQMRLFREDAQLLHSTIDNTHQLRIEIDYVLKQFKISQEDFDSLLLTKSNLEDEHEEQQQMNESEMEPVIKSNLRLFLFEMLKALDLPACDLLVEAVIKTMITCSQYTNELLFTRFAKPFEERLVASIFITIQKVFGAWSRRGAVISWILRQICHSDERYFVWSRYARDKRYVVHTLFSICDLTVRFADERANKEAEDDDVVPLSAARRMQRLEHTTYSSNFARGGFLSCVRRSKYAVGFEETNSELREIESNAIKHSTLSIDFLDPKFYQSSEEVDENELNVLVSELKTCDINLLENEASDLDRLDADESLLKRTLKYFIESVAVQIVSNARNDWWFDYAGHKLKSVPSVLMTETLSWMERHKERIGEGKKLEVAKIRNSLKSKVKMKVETDSASTITLVDGENLSVTVSRHSEYENSDEFRVPSAENIPKRTLRKSAAATSERGGSVSSISGSTEAASAVRKKKIYKVDLSSSSDEDD